MMVLLMFITLNFSLRFFFKSFSFFFSVRLGRCYILFLFSCDTVWAVFFAGRAAFLLDGKFTFHPRIM